MSRADVLPRPGERLRGAAKDLGMRAAGLLGVGLGRAFGSRAGAGILTYHVVQGNVPAAKVVELTGATSLNGQRIDVKVENGAVSVDQANVVRQPDWETFSAAMTGRRVVLATTQAQSSYINFGFRADDVILVGRESAGVPDHVRDSTSHHVSIPMQPGTRSLNVAVATAMITGEALRQTAWQSG